MTTLNITRERLNAQHLCGVPFDTPEDAVRHLGAVQSQDYAAGKWALALRVRNATDASIEEAFNEGRILRTHVMRPTWHFVMPADIRWMLRLTAPRVITAMASSNRKLELDDSLIARSNGLIVRAIEGGAFTRQELKQALERAGIRTDVQRLAHIVMRAELEGLICSGPRRGKQFTYALLEKRVPKVREPGRDEALAELALRYFTSHGPAQSPDFAWWSGLTMKDAVSGIEMAKSKLTGESLDGKTYWFSPRKLNGKPTGPKAFLLSIYDEYTIAYRDRGALGDGRFVEKLISMGNALTSVLLLDGRITGTWRRVFKKGKAEIAVKPFVKLSRIQAEAIEAEAGRYGLFIGMPVELKISAADEAV